MTNNLLPPYRGESDRRKHEKMARHYEERFHAAGDAGEDTTSDVVILRDAYRALSQTNPEALADNLLQLAATASYIAANAEAAAYAGDPEEPIVLPCGLDEVDAPCEGCDCGLAEED